MTAGELFGGATWKAEMAADWAGRYEPADIRALDPADPDATGDVLLSSAEIAARFAPTADLDTDSVGEAMWRGGFPVVECPDGVMRWAMHPKSSPEGRR